MACLDVAPYSNAHLSDSYVSDTLRANLPSFAVKQEYTSATMLFKRTLQRESDLSNRTITIDDSLTSCKYMVVVFTVKSQIPSCDPHSRQVSEMPTVRQLALSEAASIPRVPWLLVEPKSWAS